MNIKFIYAILLIFSSFSFTVASHRPSNKYLPDYGDVDKTDLKMKNCSYDPEYEYTLESNNPADIPDWYFQDEIPVRYSYFDIKVPGFKNSLRQAQADKSDVMLSLSC